MLRFLKSGSMAFAVLTLISLPLEFASAHQTGVSMGMAVRNDYPPTAITIPAGYYPRAGTCRLWYPNRPAQQQPAVSDCNVVIPLGAILLLG